MAASELVSAMEVKVGDIKKELVTKDEEVEDTGDLREVPLVAVKVEALEDMKIENGDQDKRMENPVEVFLVDPKTEVKEESDDGPDPMEEVDVIHKNMAEEEEVRGKKRKRRSGVKTRNTRKKLANVGDTEVGSKASKVSGLLAGMEVREDVLEELVDEPDNIQEKAEEEELVGKSSGKKTARGGKREHKCQEEDCQEVFSNKSNLNHHIKTVQNKEKRHQCEHQTCGAKFARKSNLDRHIKAVHRKEKPHQCEHQDCGANFTDKRVLLAHYRSEHGLAKLKCQKGNCGEEFTRQSTLDSHIKAVHNIEKPHQCEHQTCGAQFARKDHLLGHYRSKHGLAKLKCQGGDCAAEFTHLSALHQHMKTIHNKEKLHQCKHQPCGAKFATKHELPAHYRSKHGLAKLKCQEGNCEKEFTAHKSLSYHIKKVHRCGVPECAFRGSDEAVADHGRAHHGHTRLPCPVDACTKLFIFKAVQHAHVKKEHGRG